MDIIIASITEPPYDINGSGIPTTGIKPETIAMFIITYINKFVPTPIDNSLPKMWFDLILIK